MINRTYLYIMVTTLTICLAVGFVWSIVLNISANSELATAIEKFIDMAKADKIEEYYKITVPPEAYQWDGNDPKQSAEERDKKIKKMKADAKQFFDLMKKVDKEDYDILNVAFFDRVGAVVRFDLPEGSGLRELRETVEQVSRIQYNNNLSKCSIDNVSEVLIGRIKDEYEKPRQQEMFEKILPLVNGYPETRDKFSEVIPKEEYRVKMFKLGHQIHCLEKLKNNPLDQFLAEGWGPAEVKKLYELFKATLPYEKINDFKEDLLYVERLIRYLEHPELIGDFENIFFLAREDENRELYWTPLYYQGGRKVINPVSFLLSKQVADIPKLPTIKQRMLKYARQVIQSRQKAKRNSTTENILKKNLRLAMDLINENDETLEKMKKTEFNREDFVEWGTPDFIDNQSSEKQARFMGEMWDLFRPQIVFKPQEEPENPFLVKAAFPNLMKSSIHAFESIKDKNTAGDCVGGALKVLFNSARTRKVDFGASIGKQEWHDVRWEAVYYVTMLRFYNPETGQYRWLAVSIDEDYSRERLLKAIRDEIERREKLDK